MAPLDFFSRSHGLYNRANESRHTWFCQLIESCACVPVLTHRIPHAPFKLYMVSVRMGNRGNLKESKRDLRCHFLNAYKKFWKKERGGPKTCDPTSS